MDKKGRNSSVWFSDGQLEAIDAAAREQGVTRNALIRKAVSASLTTTDQEALDRRLNEMETTLKTTLLWLKNFTFAVYSRLPEQPKDMRQVIFTEATNLYNQHSQRVDEAMKKVNGKATGA